MLFGNFFCSIICIFLVLIQLGSYGNETVDEHPEYIPSEPSTSERSLDTSTQAVGNQSEPKVEYLGKFCTAVCCKEVYAVSTWMSNWKCTESCFALRGREDLPTHRLRVELLQIWQKNEIDWLIKAIQSAGDRLKQKSYWLPICYDELEREDVNFGKIATTLKNFVRLGENHSKACRNCPPLSSITISVGPEPGNPTCLAIKQGKEVVAWYTDIDLPEANAGGCICQLPRKS